MSQFDFGTIVAATKTGTQLASDLNQYRDAIHSSHAGSTAPSYIETGMVWADNTSANLIYKAYDGGASIPVFALDATNNFVRAAPDFDADSYITYSADDVMSVVIAGVEILQVDANGLTISAGTIIDFASAGIDDQATATRLTITDATTTIGNAVAITSGSITGITDLAVADGGTGASTASAARTNLGLGSAAVETAAEAATGNTVVKRNADGDVNAHILILANNEQLDATNAGAGALAYDASDGLYLNLNGTIVEFWHTGNDGAGSGLDADTVDGIQAADLGGGGWELLATEVGDGTNDTLDITGLSGYKAVMIDMEGAGADVLAIRLSDDNGVSFETGNYKLEKLENSGNTGASTSSWGDLHDANTTSTTRTVAMVYNIGTVFGAPILYAVSVGINTNAEAVTYTGGYGSTLGNVDAIRITGLGNNWNTNTNFRVYGMPEA